MKRIFLLASVALLVFGMATIALAEPFPATIQVNGSATPLFGEEVNPITDSTAAITLTGSGTINDLFLVIAVPDSLDKDTQPSNVTVNGGSTQIIGFQTTNGSATGPLMGNGGDLVAGLNIYDDIIKIGGNNSESFVNLTLNADKDVTNFDIWVYDLNTGLKNQTDGGIDTVAFTTGLLDGTYVLAYGTGVNNAGSDTTFVTKFTETGLKVPEPSMLMLFGSGLLALGIFGRRKFTK